ncbi:MAG: LPS export ABC transporter periplasmic protein LptC [Deltaproteobacteria bacterium]|nr:LPS export ABC transporter periplasmic protein LptC [Deltaproteobacteria bacterium]MBW2070504.1 LPS export ABC transporter periplasmic protein LptC [Deltaproteobacteria bacterium]
MQQQKWRQLRSFRWFIGLAMILVAGVVVVTMESGTGKSPEDLLAANPAPDDKANVTLDQLDFSDVSEGKASWTLKASQARYYKEQQVTAFTNVQAVFYMKDGSRVELRGDEGTLHNDTRDVEIKGEVRVKVGDQYRLTTERLFYSNKERSITTPDPVVIEGQGIFVRGRGMILALDSHSLRIMNQVEARMQAPSLTL